MVYNSLRIKKPLGPENFQPKSTFDKSNLELHHSNSINQNVIRKGLSTRKAYLPFIYILKMIDFMIKADYNALDDTINHFLTTEKTQLR